MSTPTDDGKIIATPDDPWSDAQVAALAAYQADPMFHPYTCGGDRGSEPHVRAARLAGAGDYGILTPAPDGWNCPVCGYHQSWALAMHARETQQEQPTS